MKIQFTLFLLCIPMLINAQVDYTEEAKKDLKELKIKFTQSRIELTEAQETLKALTDSFSPEVKTYYDEVINIKKTTDSLYDVAKTSLSFYTLKRVTKEVLDEAFTLPTDYKTGIKTVEEVPDETYVLFGDDTLILKDSILKNPTAYKVFTNVLSSESETYFGDFWFPKDGAEIPITMPCSQDDPPNCTNEEEVQYLKFDSMHLELYEGSIYDITVYLKDSSGSVFVFENKSSISLLNFGKLSGRNYQPSPQYKLRREISPI